MKTAYIVNGRNNDLTYFSLLLTNAFYIKGITERIIKVLEKKAEKRTSYTKRKSFYLTNGGIEKVKIITYYVSLKHSELIIKYLNSKIIKN